MKVINTIREMRHWAKSEYRQGNSIGLVPTMGFLHEGHLSLIKESKEKTDRTVVSIYVNPTQFAPEEDLERYPRDFKRDEQLCQDLGVDVIFYPSNQEMYLAEHRTFVMTEKLSKVLCGRTRPTHFKGVTTVVMKLFNIVQPDIAVFGQKDAQQAIIIQKMVDDLNIDVNLHIAPTVREPDGLAMSSRNKYLNAQEREQATVLYNSLQMAKNEFESGIRDAGRIRRKMIKLIEAKPSVRIDYVDLVDANTLTKANVIDNKILVAIAVYFGKTRLIDNIVLDPNE